MKELTIDTNIFIRYFINDDEIQYKKAREFFVEIEDKKSKGFISILVITEIIWVLENYYELKRKVFLPKLIHLLLLKDIKIIEIDKKKVIDILKTMKEKNIDFTDLYLLKLYPAQKIFSFDKDIKK